MDHRNKSGDDNLVWHHPTPVIARLVPAIPRRKLTVDLIIASLQQSLGDIKIQQAAQRLGKKTRTKDGVANAVSFF